MRMAPTTFSSIKLSPSSSIQVPVTRELGLNPSVLESKWKGRCIKSWSTNHFFFPIGLPRGCLCHPQRAHQRSIQTVNLLQPTSEASTDLDDDIRSLLKVYYRGWFVCSVLLCHGSVLTIHNILLQILPLDLHDSLLHQSKQAQLLEVVLDLGRLPEARYLGQPSRRYLRSTEVSIKELEYAQNAVGEFGGDNRAGIDGTLHRISAIRNRKGEIVGLTCRVGRAVSGHSDMVQDLLQFGESLLFVGRPGVGKTTALREISCFLSEQSLKRVVIVDTSNEIGGGGDAPHPAIGAARRMQVPKPSKQHTVMIEAVENHMPEVIIVDEIGTEAEVNACRSIAERGVMLIGTAHGERLENIMKNPSLSNLIGGVETVILGDQEARSRNSRKSILERKAPPTFPFLIEMRERDYWVTHRTERSVDLLLRGKKPLVEVRRRDKQFKVVIERWKIDD